MMHGDKMQSPYSVHLLASWPLLTNVMFLVPEKCSTIAYQQVLKVDFTQKEDGGFDLRMTARVPL
jgi:hypothetical protein